MPSVGELSEPYEHFMLGPRHGPGVCRTCFNFTLGYEHCYCCERHPSVLDAIVPISYSVGHEQLHHSLASYKRLGGDVGRRLALQLAAVLWRFLDLHERCIAESVRTDAFPLVTTVPSSDRLRDASHPLRWIVSELVGPTRSRYRPVLARSDLELKQRLFSPQKFVAISRLDGEPVLLIDDTWTTGSNAQSAAATLKSAGAGKVAAVVIGRHVNRDWHQNDGYLRALETPFRWDHCVLCAADATTRTEATAA